jgi:hypothetical protein
MGLHLNRVKKIGIARIRLLGLKAENKTKFSTPIAHDLFYAAIR